MRYHNLLAWLYSQRAFSSSRTVLQQIKRPLSQVIVAALCLCTPTIANAEYPEDEPTPRRDRDEATRLALRVRGRVYFGGGIGVEGVFGAGWLTRVGVFLSPHIAIEGGTVRAAELWGNGGQTTTTVDVSAILIGDTIFAKVGAAYHHANIDREFSHDWYDSLGTMLGFGNRWDRRYFFISAEWLGIYLPTVPLLHQRQNRDDPHRVSASKSGGDFDLRIANVTMGLAF